MAAQIVYQSFKLTLAHPRWDIPYSPGSDPYQIAFNNTTTFIRRLNLCLSMTAMASFIAGHSFSYNPSLQNRTIEIRQGLGFGACTGFISIFTLRLNHLKQKTYQETLEQTQALVRSMHLASLSLSILSACAFGISEKLAKNPRISSISSELVAPFFGAFLASNAIMNYMREHMDHANRAT